MGGRRVTELTNTGLIRNRTNVNFQTHWAPSSYRHGAP